jgi:hypothetical protein
METTNKILKNKKKYLPLFFLVVFLTVVAFFLAGKANKENSIQNSQFLKQNYQTSDIQYVKIAGQTLKVDLATTPQAQAQGLSGRKNLASDAGMLFIFPTPDKYYFWMKDMNFSIDMIWLNENLQVIYIEKNADPASYPDTFGPNQNSKYVLEVSSGFSDKNNLKVGDFAGFLP